MLIRRKDNKILSIKESYIHKDTCNNTKDFLEYFKIHTQNPSIGLQTNNNIIIR